MRAADSLTTHPILENNAIRRDFYTLIIANDRNNINISAHYPITLNDIQAGYIISRKSADLMKYINNFENQLNNKYFYVPPILNINGSRNMVIMYYMKDLDIVAVYYKDLTSIIKSSAIERDISIILSNVKSLLYPFKIATELTA